MPKPADSVRAGSGRIEPDHFHEGPDAARKFDQVVRGVLSVPREALDKQRQAKPPVKSRTRRRAQ